MITSSDCSNNSISSSTKYILQHQNFYNINREQRQQIIIPELEKSNINKNETSRITQTSLTFSKKRVLI